MTKGFARFFRMESRQLVHHLCRPLAALIVLVFLFAGTGAGAQKTESEMDEINDEFHFLGPLDTLLIHEEDGKLKGQINVYAGEEESDSVLSYFITIGTRQKNHVEFKTSKVHQKYFRFSGRVEPGSGSREDAPDYLRLIGDLEIITVDGMTGKESTERKQVVFKSLGADEIEE